MKPGGQLLVSEYCYGPNHSPAAADAAADATAAAFGDYVAMRQYRMITQGQYGDLLSK